jgi:hypothetical protein
MSLLSNGMKRNRFSRNYIVNVTFLLKGYNKGDIDLPLSTINSLYESLESMFF